MSPALVITIITCATLIVAILFKPRVSIFKKSFASHWIIALLGALTMLATAQVSGLDIIARVTSSDSINPLKILTLFFSMTMISIALDELGFFKYLANKAVKSAKTSQRALFLYMYLAASFLTLFTSNDIVILTFTPFICYFAKSAKINPIPYLFTEFVAANTWSMALVIGNPTNIYLASINDLGFVEYASVMLLPTISAGIFSYFLLRLIFRKQLSAEMQPCVEVVRIRNKTQLAFAVSVLALCTIALVFSTLLNLEMWLISFVSAIILAIFIAISRFCNKSTSITLKQVLKRVPWNLAIFVLSMTTIVAALVNDGSIELIAKALSSVDTIWGYGFASFFGANLINNIPMSIMFAEVIDAGYVLLPQSAIYASIIGSNLCAFFTPIGALAGIMWAEIVKGNKIEFNFLTFVKYGIISATSTLAVALFVLSILL